MEKKQKRKNCMPEKYLFSKEGKLNKEIFIWHSLCNIQQIESGMEKKKVDEKSRLSHTLLKGIAKLSARFFQNRTILLLRKLVSILLRKLVSILLRKLVSIVYFHLQGFFYNTTKKEKIYVRTICKAIR